MKKNKIIFFILISLFLLTIFYFSCDSVTSPTSNGSGDNVTTTTILEVDNAVAYKCVGSDATYFVFINADDVTRDFTVSEGLTGAICVVDAKQAGTTEILSPIGVTTSSDGKKVTLSPITSAIFKK